MDLVQAVGEGRLLRDAAAPFGRARQKTGRARSTMGGSSAHARGGEDGAKDMAKNRNGQEDVGRPRTQEVRLVLERIVTIAGERWHADSSERLIGLPPRGCLPARRVPWRSLRLPALGSETLRNWGGRRRGAHYCPDTDPRPGLAERGAVLPDVMNSNAACLGG